MPVFHRNFLEKSANTPSPEHLRNVGPRLPVEIAIPDTLATALSQKGETLPAPVSGYALFDTGASITGIDEEVLKQLGLNPIGITNISTPSDGQVEAALYPAKITFPTTPMPTFNFTSVVGIKLKNQGYLALIGRDFMSGMIVIYDGVGARVTFAF
jgi:predicted aspartyl protease